MVGDLLRSEPDLATDVLFGAAALVAVEARFSRHVLGCWQEGRSSLLSAARLDAPDAFPGATSSRRHEELAPC
jgi:hypothetical protein